MLKARSIGDSNICRKLCHVNRDVRWIVKYRLPPDGFRFPLWLPLEGEIYTYHIDMMETLYLRRLCVEERVRIDVFLYAYYTFDDN